MITNRMPRSRRRREQGYALILVVFMATMLLLGVIVVAPNIRTGGQREKEKEMIWRGRQYVRGVKLYFRKTGHFPTSLDDLTKPKIGSLRFMRQAYKDPMNKQDGSWRLIYVALPGGQLIGSLKPQQQNVQFGQAAGIGTPVSAIAGSSALGSPGAFGQSGGQNPFGQQGPGTQPGGSGSSGLTPVTTGTPVSADQGIDPNAPIPSGNPPTIIGGNIIGVGSTVDKKSIMVYEKAKNYKLFEFVWDPSKDVGRPGVQGLAIGSLPGQSTLGQPLQGPANQTPQQPPQQQQNPQQQ